MIYPENFKGTFIISKPIQPTIISMNLFVSDLKKGGKKKERKESVKPTINNVQRKFYPLSTSNCVERSNTEIM